MKVIEQGSLTIKSELAAVLNQFNTHLSSRSFFVGNNLTLADLIIFDAIYNNKEEWSSLRGKYPHLNRWFDFIGSFPEITKYVEKEQKEAKKGTGGSFIDLPNAVHGKK